MGDNDVNDKLGVFCIISRSFAWFALGDEPPVPCFTRALLSRQVQPYSSDMLVSGFRTHGHCAHGAQTDSVLCLLSTESCGGCVKGREWGYVCEVHPATS